MSGTFECCISKHIRYQEFCSTFFFFASYSPSWQRLIHCRWKTLMWWKPKINEGNKRTPCDPTAFGCLMTQEAWYIRKANSGRNWKEVTGWPHEIFKLQRIWTEAKTWNTLWSEFVNIPRNSLWQHVLLCMSNNSMMALKTGVVTCMITFGRSYPV